MTYCLAAAILMLIFNHRFTTVDVIHEIDVKHTFDYVSPIDPYDDYDVFDYDDVKAKIKKRENNSVVEVFQ